MNKQLRTLLAGLSITVLAAGCKLEVIAVQGGDVSWSDGSCLEGNNCVIEISDPAFADNFTVTPKPGYEFVKWQKGEGFLCGEETGSCAFTLPADAGAAAFIISLYRTGYIMPVYADIGFDTDGDGEFDRTDEDDDNDGVLDVDDLCPLEASDGELGCPGRQPSNLVNIDGKLWAQPNEFPSVSFEELEAICPGGVCSGFLATFGLQDINLTGWRWASPDEVGELFDALFSASCDSSPTPNFYNNCDVGALASSVGFEGLDIGVPSRDGDIKGWVSQSTFDTPINCGRPLATPYAGFIQIMDSQQGLPRAFVDSAASFCVDDKFIDYGAWLYRVP